MRISSTLKRRLLLVAFVVTIAGCGGGGGGVQTVQGEAMAALSDATVLYSKLPRINEEFSISIRQQTNAGKRYIWSVISQPAGANLVLTPVSQTDGVTFTPVVAGDYQFRVSSETESTTVNFYIDPNFPFSTDKVSLHEGSFADDTYAGRVTNQVWLYSRTLNQLMLEQLAAQYPAFQVIGFDSVNGLLLQFDESDLNNQSALGNMKLESGVVSVVHRIVTGDKFVEEADLTPDDGSSFTDGGDNWHLERIGAEQAWDITTGSDNILIGVSEPDKKFFINHEDLIGRFGLTMVAGAGDESHPSTVAGVIGAITNNGKGMSGLNWVSKMATADSGEDELRRLAGSGSIKVINSSWGLLNVPADDTDMADSSVASAREQRAFDRTRGYRKLMESFPNHLFVNSAGNGFGGENGTAVDGRYHSPALQYAEIGTLRPVTNSLFVAAMEQDGRLRESSNYGESVEIAAPSGFKSIEGENGYGTFYGTSMAAPVVSGVASLIYSVNPNFSAHTVKAILLSSATEFVTERHTEPSNDGATELLPNPIPVVNAAAALRMAADLAAGLKAEVLQSIDNPFVNTTHVQVLSATGEFETVSFPYELNGVPGIATGPEVRLPIEGLTGPLILSSTEVKFRNRGLGSTTTGTFEQTLENPRIALNLYSASSNLPVGDAQITIEPVNVFNSRFDSATGAAGANGQTSVFLMSGAYRVIVNASGYEKFSTLINIVNQGQRIFVNLPLTSAIDPVDPIGAGQDSCLIGKWALDMVHFQEQLDLTDSGFVVSGQATAQMPPDGIGTMDVQLTFTASNDVDGEPAFITTITQVGEFKYRWGTDDNVYLVESRGSTVNELTIVTIDGVIISHTSDGPPVSVNEPGNNSSPYTCQGNVWTVEASGENTVATRFNRL
ncbi:MAG: S8 family serine peptidase [Burkholderiaceae bacterium]